MVSSPGESGDDFHPYPQGLAEHPEFEELVQYVKGFRGLEDASVDRALDEAGLGHGANLACPTTVLNGAHKFGDWMDRVGMSVSGEFWEKVAPVESMTDKLLDS